MNQEPTLERLFLEAAASAIGPIHTMFPARVLKYEATQQKVTVQSVVRFRRMIDGVLETYLPPPIANIQVGFLSNGTHSITFPIEVGSHGIVICGERSIDEWRATGNDDCTPQDPRRFNLSDAMFMPMGRPFSNPIPPTGWDSDAMVLGGELLLGSSLAVSPIALEPLLKAFLESFALTYSTHVHSDPISGVTGTPLTPAPSVPDFAATMVKGI